MDESTFVERNVLTLFVALVVLAAAYFVFAHAAPLVAQIQAVLR